jgi:hypothetical protein
VNRTFREQYVALVLADGVGAAQSTARVLGVHRMFA